MTYFGETSLIVTNSSAYSNTYLLLNSEFTNDSVLKAFEFIALEPGQLVVQVNWKLIDIFSNSQFQISNFKIVKIIDCANSCAQFVYDRVYQNDFKFSTSYSWTITFNQGYNFHNLTSVNVEQGSMIILTLMNGQIALSSKSCFPDYIVNLPSSTEMSKFQILNSPINYKVCFRALVQGFFYMSNINFQFFTNQNGLYNLMVTMFQNQTIAAIIKFSFTINSLTGLPTTASAPTTPQIDFYESTYPVEYSTDSVLRSRNMTTVNLPLDLTGEPQFTNFESSEISYVTSHYTDLMIPTTDSTTTTTLMWQIQNCFSFNIQQ